MPTLTLDLQQNITGSIKMTPVTPFIDPANPLEIVSVEPYTANIASGLATINVPSSLQAQVTYLVETSKTISVTKFFYQSGEIYSDSTNPVTSNYPKFQHTDSNWYTGTSFVSGTSKILSRVVTSENVPILDNFYCIVPTVNTNFVNLYKTSITSQNLDQSAWRIADLMSSEGTFRSRLSSFVWKGSYNSATTYTKNDVAQFNGQSWIYISNTNQAGINPGTNATVWELFVDKGGTGGVGANSIGWNRTQWNTSPINAEAVSRGDAVALFDAIPQPDLSALATDAELASAISAIKRIPMPVGYAQLTSDIVSTAGSSALKVLAYNQRPFTVNNIINSVGDIIIPENGLYLFVYSFAVSLFSNWSGTSNRIKWRVLLNRFLGNPTGSVGELARFEHMTLTGSGTIEQQMAGIRLLDCVAGQQYNTQFATNAGDSDSSGASSTATMVGNATNPKNQIMVWRVGSL